MKEQQMQAEYQTHLKEQYYLDQMKKDKEESQASLEGANERLEGVKRTKEAQGREASEAMQAMEDEGRCSDYFNCNPVFCLRHNLVL